MTATDAPPAPAAPTDRYTIISADCHAGGNHAQYREYLTAELQEEFDAWRGGYKNPFRDLQDDGRSRNWDDDRRWGDLEADGVVAEIIFPNTVPPFFPTGIVIARPPKPDEYRLRWAGIQAHNRWMADFCALHPERRAGIAQIFLNDVDDAVAEIKWAKEAGLRGGVLIPNIPPDFTDVPPLYDPVYDPIWRTCEELGIPVNSHSGTGLPDYGKYPAAQAIWVMETPFFAHRPLWFMLMSGVFERFPGLRFVMTESGAAWVPETLQRLDGLWMATKAGRTGEIGFDPSTALPNKPSEYFDRNCWIGVSFPSPREAKSRQKIGLHKFMWGADYPHHEGSTPFSKESLRRAFADVGPDELHAVLANNAAHVYDFDLAALAPHAARVGPTVAELSEPYDGVPKGATSPCFFQP
jgi:predicted TIM-barrel fold metal-dependent hydrolase